MNPENLEKIMDELENSIYLDLSKNFNAFLVGTSIALQPELQNLFIRTYGCFREEINRFNKNSNLTRQNGRIVANLNPSLNFQGTMMGIMVFELLKNSKFNKKINHTSIFKFAKHIRNGCAHNNKFYFEKPVKTPIIWDEYTIDNNLQGKEVIPGFISTFAIFFLARDIVKEINRINKYQ